MGNKIQKFLLFCSGASETILAQTKCTREYSKYSAIGASVFFTALLAFLSGSYAFYSIFNSTFLALSLGLLWGAMIFNLDRFLVSTLRKRRVAQDLPFRERLRQNSHVMFSAIPRLLFGLFISVVVATPLQLKMFESEIETQLVQSNAAAVQRVVTNIKQDFSRIDDLEHQNYELNELIDEGRQKVKISRTEALGELQGWTGTRVPGAGPIYEQRKAEVSKTDAELRELIDENRPVIYQNAQVIMALRAKRDALIEEARLGIQQANGLLSRLSALKELSESNPTVKWAYYFILFLFIFLEITPLLVKLLSPRGTYDDVLDSLEGRIQGSGVVAERLVITEEREGSRSLQFGVFILELILPAKNKDYIVGDLLESYSNRPSKAWASFWVYRQVLTSIVAQLLNFCRDAISRRINRP